ncbi:unnamed protein product [Caenorhabditis angaria]|uniref:S-protein homolog n=1 Tax=Caenorhabditis angaria TaxID=860376 RepID=A0A9P1IBE4_9PELO|nr:unnamed protein product [Caenorhabditis angaria]
MKFFVIFILIIIGEVQTRRYRKMNELFQRAITITIHNHAEANVRIRCQSIKTDLLDRFLGPMSSFRFQFYDIDRGNLHFWCDAYGLFGFFESFDVFGRSASTQRNVTWFLKNDGLYLENVSNRKIEWQWVYPPFETYAIESINSIDISSLPVWVPFQG